MPRMRPLHPHLRQMLVWTAGGVALLFWLGCGNQRSATCVGNNECQPGRICINARCVVQCYHNSHCQPNERCDPTLFVCRTRDTRPAPVCGNGIVDTGESCDGQQYNGQTCLSLGFTSGKLACSTSCTFDTAGCQRASSCGNGAVDINEECDGQNLNGQTCQTRGFASGTLVCSTKCTFDTSGCQAAKKCGNGSIDGTEECDGQNLNGQTCQTKGFASGTLTCLPTCRLNTSACQNAPKTCSPPCQSGQVCDTNSLTCVECLTNTDCTNGVCANQRCVACTKDSDCNNGICDANKCVACRDNAQCTKASTSRCHKNQCQGCSSDADCKHISGKPNCQSGTCKEKFNCEDWDNNANAPCPKGTKNCDCSGGCGAVTCGGSGTPQSGCFTVANTSVRSFEPQSSGGHGSGAFLWKPISDSNGKLVILFPAKLPANKGWVQLPNGTKEYSVRVTVSNPDRKTHFFSKPGKSYPNGSKACWSNQ